MTLPSRRDAVPAVTGRAPRNVVPFTGISAGIFGRALAIALLAFALLAQPPGAVAALDSLPNLGDSSSDDLSPIVERKLGEEIMREIRKSNDYLDDAETREYLNQFGSNLALHAPASLAGFEFFAVKDAGINAFALPGGFIGVNSGLVVAAQSESELASVMAHEMGHVVQRHIARMLGRQRQSSLVALGALVLGAIAGSAGGGDLAQGTMMMGQGFALQDQLRFSRDAEREADRVGFQILNESGLDVTAMVTFFGRLQQTSRLQSDVPPWWLTHPMTTERMADIQNRIREAPYRQRADSQDFHLLRARLRVVQDTSVQSLRNHRASFEDQLKSGTYSNEAAIRYGLALVLLYQRDAEGAQNALDQARKLVRGSNAMLDKLAIEIRLAAGDASGAVTLAKAALNRFPQSRMMAAEYAEALQAANRHDEAIGFLRDQIQLYRQEPGLYSMLAKSHAARGNDLLQHKYQAEAYYLQGNYQAALDQLQIARRTGKGDFFELSQIDARAREIQTLITERARERGDKGEKDDNGQRWTETGWRSGIIGHGREHD